MNPEPGIVHASRVNELMLKALDAELVFVAAPRSQNPMEVADAIAIASRGYGPLPEGRQVSCILNRVCIGAAGQQSRPRPSGRHKAAAPTAKASRRSPRWKRPTGRPCSR